MNWCKFFILFPKYYAKALSFTIEDKSAHQNIFKNNLIINSKEYYYSQSP